MCGTAADAKPQAVGGAPTERALSRCHAGRGTVSRFCTNLHTRCSPGAQHRTVLSSAGSTWTWCDGGWGRSSLGGSVRACAQNECAWLTARKPTGTTWDRWQSGGGLLRSTNEKGGKLERAVGRWRAALVGCARRAPLVAFFLRIVHCSDGAALTLTRKEPSPENLQAHHPRTQARCQQRKLDGPGGPGGRASVRNRAESAAGTDPCEHGSQRAGDAACVAVHGLRAPPGTGG